MKTLNLARKQVTLQDVLQLAAKEAVRIVAPDGQAFVLEEVAAFEREVKALGKSKKFRRFLNERSKEPATTSLEDYRRSLD